MNVFKKIAAALLLLLSIYFNTHAQNVGINTTGATPDASAMLDISCENKGLLVPRVALTATNTAGPITSPTTSLLVYNTATAGVAPDNVIPGFYYWNGTSWTGLSVASQSSTSSWALGGNTGTNAVSDFIGTTDDTDLVFKTANTEIMRLYSGGGVDIDAGVGEVNEEGSALFAVGDYNNYLEINVQNLSNGNKASSDLVATANNGTGSSVYVDMGINSQAYSNGASNILNGPNLAYIYSNARDFKIGNGSPNYDLIFFTNPLGGQVSTITGNGLERMRISQNGNVGVGTNNPNSTLSVGGSLTMAVRTGNTAYTITATDHVVIHTGSTGRAWVLPVASTCPGRIYKLINNGTGSATITLSEYVTTSGGVTTNALPVTAGSNIFQIISDGSSWIKIN